MCHFNWCALIFWKPLFCFDTGFCVAQATLACYIVKEDFVLLIFVLLPPKCSDYMYVPPHPDLNVLWVFVCLLVISCFPLPIGSAVTI